MLSNLLYFYLMKKISKPSDTEHALYYNQFIQLVSENEPVLKQLKINAKKMEDMVYNLSDEALTTNYEKGKWTIKDILQHLIDSERVFVCRAMRFARNDKSPQLFFDENSFAKEANAIKTPLRKLIKEYKTTRQATITFFENQNAVILRRTGIASNSCMSVRACAWIICGHEIHHLQVIANKYLIN